jgi:hypothetical protein
MTFAAIVVREDTGPDGLRFTVKHTSEAKEGRRVWVTRYPSRMFEVQRVIFKEGSLIELWCKEAHDV